MSNLLAVTCQTCQHTWQQDLALLEETAEIYKGRVTHKVYRVPCPRCGTNHVIKVAFKEQRDG